MGLSPKIIRKSNGGCCDWCNKLVGTYDYSAAPGDVYRRHENCNCTVDYDPGSGKTQNVWTKAWTSSENSDILEERKFIGLKVNGTTITEVKVHFDQRKEEREVAISSALDAINNPLKCTDTKYDELGRPSFNAIGAWATVSVNPETGAIVTVHKTHTK